VGLNAYGVTDTTFGDTDLVKIIKDNTKEDGHVDGTYDVSIN